MFEYALDMYALSNDIESFERCEEIASNLDLKFFLGKLVLLFCNATKYIFPLIIFRLFG